MTMNQRDMLRRTPQLVEIDLSRGHQHKHPDIYSKRSYLALWNGELWFGQFERVHFGWHFACGFGVSGGFQFDAPGYNHSLWQRLWEVEWS